MSTNQTLIDANLMTTCKFYQVLNCHELSYHSTSFCLSRTKNNSHVYFRDQNPKNVRRYRTDVPDIKRNLADDWHHLICTEMHLYLHLLSKSKEFW